MLSKALRPHVDQFNEGSDDDVRVLSFDDSEEEITCKRNEGFMKVVVEMIDCVCMQMSGTCECIWWDVWKNWA